jgi:pyruvate/2-oxoglutarate/acetoin dehydrogenase E1 component
MPSEVFQDDHGIALGSQVVIAADNFGLEPTEGEFRLSLSGNGNGASAFETDPTQNLFALSSFRRRQARNELMGIVYQNARMGLRMKVSAGGNIAERLLMARWRHVGRMRQRAAELLAQTEVPVVYRVSVGAGKGYGGQHSQTLESMFCHIPGLYVIYPATPADAKGLLKACIRDNNPVMFVESQGLYAVKGPVPEGDYVVPIGVADVKREGSDLTFVAWGPAVHDCLKAADKLKAEKGVSCEVIDLRSLVPLDMETVLRSVQKTGRCVVASQAIHIGSYTAEIASTIQDAAFDYLDAPVKRVGAKNGIAPQSHILEAAFLPSVQDLVNAAHSIL